MLIVICLAYQECSGAWSLDRLGWFSRLPTGVCNRLNVTATRLPRVECVACTFGGARARAAAARRHPSSRPPCVVQPVKHRWAVFVLPFLGSKSPWRSALPSASGSPSDESRGIYALKRAEPRRGPPSGARPAARPGALPAKPAAEICIRGPRRGFANLETFALSVVPRTTWEG